MLGAAPGLGRLMDGGKATCSVTLVSPRWALTAGHCVAEHPPEDLELFFGDLSIGEIEPEEQVRTVRTVVLFPGWGSDDGLLVDDDLALLELDESVDEASGLAPVVLAPLTSGCNGAFYGWGATTPAASSSDRLQTVRLAIVAPATCTEHLTELGEPQLRDRLLCAGAMGGEPGACHGDSGGPLFMRRGDDQVVVGIAVGGGPSCDEYSLFASVGYYSDWIRETSAD